MPKFRSGYSKKRKFHGNQYTKQENKTASTSDRGSSISKDTSSSASARKIQQGTKKPKLTDCEESAHTQSSISGFRFVDMKVLDSM